MSQTLLEDVRQSVVGAFKSVQDTYYPTTLVNYPNITVVDLEHQVDPFVSLSLDLSKATQAALADKVLIVAMIMGTDDGLSRAQSFF